MWAEGEVGDPDADQFRAAEGAGEAQQQERAVAFAAQRAAAGSGDPDHVWGQERRGPALGPGAVAAGDALKRLAQPRIVGVERQAEQGVRLGDRGEPAGERRVGAASGQLCEMVGDQGSGGGAGEGRQGLPGAQAGSRRRGGWPRPAPSGVGHRRVRRRARRG
jgi:hypothetical protein